MAYDEFYFFATNKTKSDSLEKDHKDIVCRPKGMTTSIFDQGTSTEQCSNRLDNAPDADENKAFTSDKSIGLTEALHAEVNSVSPNLDDQAVAIERSPSLFEISSTSNTVLGGDSDASNGNDDDKLSDVSSYAIFVNGALTDADSNSKSCIDDYSVSSGTIVEDNTDDSSFGGRCSLFKTISSDSD